MNAQEVKDSLLAILKKKKALCNIRRKGHYTKFFETARLITNECRFTEAEIDLIINQMTESLGENRPDTIFLFCRTYGFNDVTNVFINHIFSHDLTPEQISKVVRTFKRARHDDIKKILEVLLKKHKLSENDLSFIMECKYQIYDNIAIQMTPAMIDQYVQTCLSTGLVKHIDVVKNHISTLSDGEHYVQNLINTYKESINQKYLAILLNNLLPTHKQSFDGITNLNAYDIHEYLDLIVQHGYIVSEKTMKYYINTKPDTFVPMYLHCKYNANFPPNSLNDTLLSIRGTNAVSIVPYTDVHQMCISRSSNIDTTNMPTSDYEEFWIRSVITHVSTFRKPGEYAPVKIVKNNDIVIVQSSCYTLMRYVTNEDPTYETFKLAIEKNNYIAIYDYLINYKYIPTLDDLHLIIQHDCYHLLISHCLRYKITPTAETFRLLISKNQLSNTVMDRFKEFGYTFPEECVHEFITHTPKINCNIFDYGIEPTEDIYFLAYMYNNTDLLQKDWRSDIMNNRLKKLLTNDCPDNYTFDFIHKGLCDATTPNKTELLTFLKKFVPTKSCYYYGSKIHHEDLELWYKQNNITKDVMMQPLEKI